MSEKSPARLACEAFWAAIGAGPDGQPLDAAWAWAHSMGAQDAWEAAAQAAVDASGLRALVAELGEALAEAAGHVEPVDQNSELAIGEWQALAARSSAQIAQYSAKGGPAVATSGIEHLAAELAERGEG